MRRFAVLVVLAAAAALLPAAPALAAAPTAAADCPSSGGVRVPPAPTTTSDFTIRGKGWGHGVGMSQYGALGAARLGCSAKQILRTYYRGVTIAPRAQPRYVRIGLTFDSPVSNVASARSIDATAGAIPWQLCASGRCQRVATQPQGSRWQVRIGPKGGYGLWEGDQRRWHGGDNVALLRAVLTTSGSASRIISIPANGHSYKWGVLEFDSFVTDGTGRAYLNLAIRSIERYLRGLSEMPSSWEPAALRAQAIVGRAYAMDRRVNLGLRENCRCHLWDSPTDQHYTGWDKESEGLDATYGRRWVAAVDDTAGRIMRDPVGGIAVGYYSSSHGGASESSAFTWGGEVSYLRSVDDSNWEMHSGNPNRSWNLGISDLALGRKFGVGRATSVTLPSPRGRGGRVGRVEAGYGGVVIQGVRGRVVVSGSSFKSVLGLRSTLFNVVQRDA
ncbi:MAG: hypothetical protein M3425_06560 [Actinomycetota bacterium]|nr:hypothetical protein [Actinomycetota bacterium]